MYVCLTSGGETSPPFDLLKVVLSEKPTISENPFVRGFLQWEEGAELMSFSNYLVPGFSVLRRFCCRAKVVNGDLKTDTCSVEVDATARHL